MRVLVVGAGAIGGYFGGRLLAAGQDVTFLVRSARAAQLRQSGLVIRSPLGDVKLADPPAVQANAIDAPFDLILLSCKAYDLDGAIDSFAPAVGPGTVILPLLNGLRHLEVLEGRFGAAAVMGGQCFISVTLAPTGEIAHLNRSDTVTFGERDGTRSTRAEGIHKNLAAGGFEVNLSEKILQEMWEKWVFIATGAGITCLMRSTVGDYIAAHGTDLALRLLAECAEIAADAGFPPGEGTLERARVFVTKPGSDFAASMLRDIERGGRTEVEHILGDLLRRRAQRSGLAAPAIPAPGVAAGFGGSAPPSLLEVACAHVRAYEARRTRLAG
jgi:2-dehydropantoate 2-reductase